MEREKLIALVVRAQAGDTAAMDELFSAFYDDVYYFARKTVRDDAVACDVTQETFLEIIRTVSSLKEPAAFVAWMKRIAYHQCTRYFKKKKDVQVAEDEDGATIFDALADERDGVIPSEVLEQADFRKIILDIIDSLTEEQRSCVMLYYFDELSVAQIAGIQGVSEGTVKSRLNYARKAIRRGVEEYENRTGTKLHAFALLPLLRVLMDDGKRLPAHSVAAVRVAMAKSGSAAAGAAPVGLAGRIAAMPAMAKICAAAAAVACIGLAAFGIAGGFGPEHPDRDGDLICDKCSQAMCVLELSDHADADGDMLCDGCAGAMCALGFDHADADGDMLCDGCAEAMCGLGFDHADADGDCLCNGCGSALHDDSARHGRCGVCGAYLPVSDGDGDGACDVCGEYACASAHGGDHTDPDGDEICDCCGEYLCAFYMGEHVTLYEDGIYDGICDNCGSNTFAYGYADDGLPHGDEDGDNVCDCCDRPVCKVYGNAFFGGVDGDGDKICDVCAGYMCDAHSLGNYHMDVDHDGYCDNCLHSICGHGFTDHTDENGDKICDVCFSGIY